MGRDYVALFGMYQATWDQRLKILERVKRVFETWVRAGPGGHRTWRYSDRPRNSDTGSPANRRHFDSR